jgi:hypothetical protein
MQKFMIYVSYEMLVMYLATAALYVAGTTALVIAIYLRGEVLGASILAPIIVVSWLGLLGQVAHVAEASADMRRHLRSNQS